MLNIKPIRDKSLNCFQGILVSVAKHFNIDYEPAFCRAWGFEYNRHNDQDILKMINPGRKDDFEIILQKHYGITIESIDVNNVYEIKNLATEELKSGMPLCVYIDSFFCPWNKAYKKYHARHYFLVIGIDENENSFICIDPYCSDNIEKIKIDNIKDGLKNCITFRFEQGRNVKVDWVNELIICINNLFTELNKKNAFEMMKMFAEDIELDSLEKFSNCKVECNINDLGFHPLVRVINQIAFGRFNFARALKYVYSELHLVELYNYLDRLKKIGQQWQEINMWIMKSFMESNSSNIIRGISAKIKSVAEEEKEIANDMYQLLLNHYNRTQNNKFNLREITENQILSNMKSVKEIIVQSYFNDFDNNKIKNAIIFKGKELTYENLNKKSDHLAVRLREIGVKPNSIVGLMVRRSFEMIIGILAIIKAGGAFLPIDPDYPEFRINYMLEDSGANILISQNELIQKVKFEGEILDIFDHELYKNYPHQLTQVNKQSDLLYVIYTSGSTGLPKGVMIQHKAICNFISGVTNIIDFPKNNTILALTTISFDIFILETILALARGLTIVIADETQQRDPKLLSDAIIANNVNMIQITPSRLKILMGTPKNIICLKNLNTIMVGGEQLPRNLLQELKMVTNARIYNMYGPTETTVWSTIKDLTDNDEVNIGKPILNTKVYILDNANNLVSEGQEGELCIAGEGLAKGYLNRPDLTSVKFIQNPFEPAGKLYKTGDLARWLENGDIEYLGRMDQQVKIRGFRIELGEIESHIREINDIRDCIVVAKDNSNGDKNIAAYYISDKTLSTYDISSYLKNYLPDYMMPSLYVRLDSFPMTPNGKVDRKALSNIGEDNRVRRDYVQPCNEIEKIIADIWKKVLKRDFVDINENFFDIGGDSLLVVLMHNELDNIYPDKIDIGDIFSYPTVLKLAEHLTKKASEDQIIQISYLNLPRDFYITDTGNREKKPLKITVKDEMLNLLFKVSKNRKVNLIDIFISLYSYLLLDITKQNKVTFYTISKSGENCTAATISLSGITELEELFVRTNKVLDESCSLNSFNTNLLFNEKNRSDNSIIPIICFQRNISSKILDSTGLILCIEKSDFAYDILLEFNSTKLSINKVEEVFFKFAKLIKAICT